jgi:hypothetical protein
LKFDKENEMNGAETRIVRSPEAEGVVIVEREHGETDSVILEVPRAVFTKRDLESAVGVLRETARKLED